MFSVVIPLYNKKRWVERCIDSIRAQTFEDWEIVVIDDGSTDDGGMIVELASQADQRIRYYRQENAGVSAARNEGVARAKSMYIALLDADDYWDSGFLQEMADLIARYPQATLFAAGFSFIRGKAQCRKSWVPPRPSIVSYFDLYLVGRFFLSSSSCVVEKRAYVHVGGFTPGVKYREDLEFWLKICSRYDVACSDKHLCHYDLEVEGQASRKIPDFLNSSIPQDVKYVIQHRLYRQREFMWFSRYIIVCGLRQLKNRHMIDGLDLDALREAFRFRSCGLVSSSRYVFGIYSLPERMYKVKALLCYYLLQFFSGKDWK